MFEYKKIYPYIFKCSNCKEGDIEFYLKSRDGKLFILIECDNCGKKKEIPYTINYIYLDIEKIDKF